MIFLGATGRQKGWWATYQGLNAGMEHDLLIAYIDQSIVPEVDNPQGKVLHESKIINGRDIPQKAFGAYRHFFNQYKDHYKYVGFVSDDVILRSDNWLRKSIEPLTLHEKIGWTATQVYSKFSQCFSNHLRAPIWFAKSEALKKIDWKFDDDHDGELRLADQFLAKGFFGVQVGHKFDVAYDSLENGGYGEGDGIVSCFEKKFFPEKELRLPFSDLELADFKRRIWLSIKNNNVADWECASPHPHIGKRNFITQLQGLDGQIYFPSLSLARRCIEIYENKKLNIQILAKYVLENKATC